MNVWQEKSVTSREWVCQGRVIDKDTRDMYLSASTPPTRDCYRLEGGLVEHHYDPSDHYHVPPLSKVRLGEKKVWSERGVCLGQERALNKGGGVLRHLLHPFKTES